MKRLSQRIASVLLLLLVIGTTTGVQLYSHICMTCGTAEVSMQQIHSCCSETGASSASANIENDCCSSGVSYLKLDLPAWQPDHDFQVLVQHIVLDLPAANTITGQDAVLCSRYFDPPPATALDGRDHQRLYQVFLI